MASPAKEEREELFCRLRSFLRLRLIDAGLRRRRGETVTWGEFQNRFDRIRAYCFRENRNEPFFSCRSLDGMRLAALESFLPGLTGRELAAEKAYWIAAEEELLLLTRRQLACDFARFDQVPDWKWAESSLRIWRWSAYRRVLALIGSDYFRHAGEIEAWKEEWKHDWLSFCSGVSSECPEGVSLYRTFCRLARAGVAIEEFRRKRGRLPEELEELAPEFLRSSPSTRSMALRCVTGRGRSNSVWSISAGRGRSSGRPGGSSGATACGFTASAATASTTAAGTGPGTGRIRRTCRFR